MDRSSGLRLARVVLVSVAFGVLIMFLALYFERGFVPGDAIVYLASGERLNAGHLVYALSPGDRYVGVKPPYWTVPTLSPPFMAVVFRPLAALPPDTGAYLWWFATMTAIGACLLALVRRAPIRTSIAMLILAIPIVYEIGVGNVNAFLLAGTLATWYFATRGHQRASGVVVAFMVMAKVWPIALAWWLVVRRDWTAVRAGLATGVVLVAISLAGAGLAAHVTYLQVISNTVSVGTSDLSIAGLGRALGLSSSLAAFLPWIVFLGCTGSAWLVRDRPAASFCLCVVAMVLGSSVVNINSYTLLLGLLAPAAWPISKPVAEAPYEPAESPLPSAPGGPNASTASSS
jgi:hypothetical protein